MQNRCGVRTITDWSKAPKRGVQIFAPAKINLTLHVTGQREDGYHLLDSLVAFASVGDELWLQIGNILSLTVEGPEAAGVPADMQNLILKVAALFGDVPGASFLLTKNLPTASGIGGGSADAAAAFRGLMCHWSDLMPGDDIPADLFDPAQSPMADQLLALGADIPVCMMSRNTRMRGIGEVLEPVGALPMMHAVLVNPRVAVSTPAIFKSLQSKTNPPMPEKLPQFAGPADLALWLSEQRNDLQPAAEKIAPEITQVLRTIEAQDGNLLARMSGSGATCFGLFENAKQADLAARSISEIHPNWWVKPAQLGDMTQWATPRIS